jgi:5-hydroxyisourate hydrolase
MSHVTTHVLDTTRGVPARGVEVTLAQADATGGADSSRASRPGRIATGTTDADGRIGDLGPEALEPGTYTLTFDTRAYWADLDVQTFFPTVTIAFEICEPPAAHYHVPLLLSPFAYSTYRGS